MSTNEIFEKKLISLRYWLLGRNYFVASKAMEFARKFHNGLRKDAKTPEFQHQIDIVLYLRTLISWLPNPEITLASAFLHDVCEDYDVGFPEIEKLFGSEISVNVSLLTKKYRNAKLSPENYYAQLLSSASVVLIKGADRINNMQDIVETFSIEKQQAYVSETENFVIPLLKQARRIFPEQEGAFENEKLILENQVRLIKIIKN